MKAPDEPTPVVSTAVADMTSTPATIGGLTATPTVVNVAPSIGSKKPGKVIRFYELPVRHSYDMFQALLFIGEVVKTL